MLLLGITAVVALIAWKPSGGRKLIVLSAAICTMAIGYTVGYPASMSTSTGSPHVSSQTNG